MRKQNVLLSRRSVIILLLLFLPACNTEDPADESDPLPTRTVSVYSVNREDVRQVINGFGNLSFRRKADITSAVDGTIRKILVEEGDRVSERQLIAELYNIQLEIRKEQAQAALFSAEAAYELAGTRYREGRLQIESSLISIEKSELNLRQKEHELEYRRGLLENKKELLKIGGTTEEEVASMELSFSALETEIMILEKDIMIKKIGFRDKDIREYGFEIPADGEKRLKLLLDINSQTLKSELKSAEAGVKSAETELHSAEALLNETKPSSPINGIVGARYMESGERIKTDGRLLTIFDSSEVDLVFSVPEETGIMLKVGQPVDLSLDALKNRRFSALIRQISPTIDTRSGNMTVKAELNNEEGLFRPGMFSRFSITYGPPRSLLLIPADALVRLDGRRGLVLRVTGGRVYPRSIVVEAESEGMHELLEGLDEGDVIVVNPSPLLKEGDPVDVRY